MKTSTEDIIEISQDKRKKQIIVNKLVFDFVSRFINSIRITFQLFYSRPCLSFPNLVLHSSFFVRNLIFSCRHDISSINVFSSLMTDYPSFKCVNRQRVASQQMTEPFSAPFSRAVADSEHFPGTRTEGPEK